MTLHGSNGSSLLVRCQAVNRESSAGKPLRIHVERFNPALQLYERLGFKQIEDKGVYLFLEWREGDHGQTIQPSTLMKIRPAAR